VAIAILITMVFSVTPAAGLRQTVVTISLGTGITNLYVSPVELSKAEVNREGDKYARALTELSSISAMALKTDADFQKTNSIVNAQTPNLRLVRFRLIQIALANTTFTKALESEFERANGNADEVLKRFRANPNSLTSLNGADQTQQSIATSLKRDYQVIKTASEHLKSAAESFLNKKQSHVVSMADYSFDPPISDYFDALFGASTIVAGAMRRASIQTGKTSGGGGPASSGSSTTTEPPHPRYNACTKRSDENHESCRRDCTEGLFKWACLARCDALYLMAEADCLLLFPQ
jgi:hypothetical protein